jgi:hypothetical protein
VPSLVARLHAWQVGHDAELQQTPSTHWPFRQSPAAPHVPETGFCGTQAPALQKYPEAQLAFVVHLVRQAPLPLHV